MKTRSAFGPSAAAAAHRLRAERSSCSWRPRQMGSPWPQEPNSICGGRTAGPGGASATRERIRHMKQIKSVIIGALGSATWLLLGAGNLQAQDPPPQGNFDPAQMRQRMAERMRQQFDVKDDAEWKTMAEQIAARRGDGRGGGRAPDPGGGGGWRPGIRLVPAGARPFSILGRGPGDSEPRLPDLAGGAGSQHQHCAVRDHLCGVGRRSRKPCRARRRCQPCLAGSRDRGHPCRRFCNDCRLRGAGRCDQVHAGTRDGRLCHRPDPAADGLRRRRAVCIDRAASFTRAARDGSSPARSAPPAPRSPRPASRSTS